MNEMVKDHEIFFGLVLQKYVIDHRSQGIGYPDPSAFCSNVEHVLTKEITRYEADLLCQNMLYITTKGKGSGYSTLCSDGFIHSGKHVSLGNVSVIF